jgi:AcrR family transcriptional regulator
MGARSKPKRREATTAPRRAPSSVEGESIVGAIVDAARELIAIEGLDRVTTNRIADRAGVSVGSLYQYFPNKESIVVAVARLLDERATDAIVAALGDALEDDGDAIEALVGAMARAGDDARIRAALFAEAPAGWTEETRARGDQRVCDALAKRLGDRAHDRAAFVAYHAALSVTRAALLQQPELLGDAAFRRELTHLVRAYVDGARRG